MNPITSEQRYAISTMLKQDFSQTVIAQTIGKHKSVVSREITRNCDQRNGEYHHDQAERKCMTRLFSKPKKRRFTPEVEGYVTALLNGQYSPEQLVDKLQRLYGYKARWSSAIMPASVRAATSPMFSPRPVGRI